MGFHLRNLYLSGVSSPLFSNSGLHIGWRGGTGNWGRYPRLTHAYSPLLHTALPCKTWFSWVRWDMEYIYNNSLISFDYGNHSLHEQLSHNTAEHCSVNDLGDSQQWTGRHLQPPAFRVLSLQYTEAPSRLLKYNLLIKAVTSTSYWIH